MAGESADALARRMREKSERLASAAAAYERGAEGERRTAAALSTLPIDEWTVLHDLRWPGRRYANVDHVVIGPPGVFVIDSKNWAGRIEVDHGVLRQNGRVRESAVAGAAEAAIAVCQLTRLVTPQLVVPVLCFVRDEPVTGWARDVVLCSTANIVQMLLTRPPDLTPSERQQLCLDLDASFRSAAVRPVARPPRGATAVDRPGKVRARAGQSRPRPSRPKRRRGNGALRELVALALCAGFVWVSVANDLHLRLGELVSSTLIEVVAPDDKPLDQERRNRERQ